MVPINLICAKNIMIFFVILSFTGLQDNSDGMTSAFSCVLDEDNPLEFRFVEFDNHTAIKNFNFERLLDEVIIELRDLQCIVQRCNDK